MTYTEAEALALFSKIDWNSWVFNPGANPQPDHLNFTTAGAVGFEQMADAYIELGGQSSPENYTNYLTTDDVQLQIIFLARLRARKADMTLAIINRVDGDFNVTTAKNPEHGQQWFPLSIYLKYDFAYAAAHHYVSYQGRMKYILPVYTALVQNGRRDLAYQWFIDNQNFYHPIALAKVRQIVLGSSSLSAKD